MNAIGRFYVQIGGISGILKTLWFNFTRFPIKTALHFPVLVSGKAHVTCRGKGHIVLRGQLHLGMLRIGFHSHEFCSYAPTTIFIGGTLNLSSGHRVTVESGCFVGVAPGCTLEFRGNAYISSGSRVVCHAGITVGDNNQWQENVWVYDHETFVIEGPQGHKLNPPEEIEFGDDVWLQPGVKIMKGVHIPDRTIVEACALIDSTPEAEKSDGWSIMDRKGICKRKNVFKTEETNFADN